MELSFICNAVTKKYLQRLLDCQRLVLPVLANMLLTLFCWVHIYEMKVDERLAALLFGNMGETLYEALLNGLCSTLMLIVVAFTMLAFAMFDLRRIVQFWLQSSCVLLLFVVSGNFFYAVIAGPEAETASSSQWLAVILSTSIYGGFGLMSYFTTWLPESVHRHYVVANCSLVSQYYLRCFPGHTVWVVLVAVALWDIYAVLSPYGPLNVAQSKAKDYSSSVLRFLMFSTNETSPVEEDIITISTASSENQPSCHTASSLSFSSFSDEPSSSSDSEAVPKKSTTTTPKKIQQTVEDALNDSNFKLGMGDFVFYGLLVGKSAVSGSILATAGCISGIIYGLLMTLVFFSHEERTTPALPISIFLGIFLHIFGLQIGLLLTPYFHGLYDVFLLGF